MNSLNIWMLSNIYIANTHSTPRHATDCIASLISRHYASLRLNVTVFESFVA